MKPARETGAPYSSTIASSRCSRRALMAACIRRSRAIRSALLVRAKAGKARLAAATAVRASSASARSFVRARQEGGEARWGARNACGATLLISEAHPTDDLRRRRVVQVEQL